MQYNNKGSGNINTESYKLEKKLWKSNYLGYEQKFLNPSFVYCFELWIAIHTYKDYYNKTTLSPYTR